LRKANEYVAGRPGGLLGAGGDVDNSMSIPERTAMACVRSPCEVTACGWEYTLDALLGGGPTAFEVGTGMTSLVGIKSREVCMDGRRSSSIPAAISVYPGRRINLSRNPSVIRERNVAA
jgi:hypothetical protein